MEIEWLSWISSDHINRIYCHSTTSWDHENCPLSWGMCTMGIFSPYRGFLYEQAMRRLWDSRAGRMIWWTRYIWLSAKREYKNSLSDRRKWGRMSEWIRSHEEWWTHLSPDAWTKKFTQCLYRWIGCTLSPFTYRAYRSIKKISVKDIF